MRQDDGRQQGVQGLSDHNESKPAVRRRRLAWSLASLSVIGIVAGLSAACSIGYYTQAIGGQMQVLNRREPIDELLASPDTAADLKSRLGLVMEIRNFATSDLGLPDNKSYRYYADLDRPYVVWNVFAAPALSVKPVSWCFLIIGCVSYRGYFSEEKAEKFAHSLSEKGDDVYVAGIAAYSTLGRFADPVLNTMIYWDDPDLAGVIFHELAHQRLYVKSDSGFSEAFATVVEEKGVVEWLDATGRRDELAGYRKQQALRGLFAQINNSARENLKEVYASDASDEEKLERKKAVFVGLKEEYMHLAAEHPGFEVYGAYFDRDLNNAHLVSVATYHDLLPPLRCVLEIDAGGDLRRFYELATNYADMADSAARHEALKTLPHCAGVPAR